MERFFKTAGPATTLFLLVVILLVTNKWFNYDDAIRIVGANDTISYRALAEAWPGLPSDQLPFHRAQRLAIPYALGGIASAFGCSVDSIFLGATLLSCAAVLFLMHKIFVSLALSATQRLLLFALLIFNPFVFRPYLAARFMVIDLVFVVGLALLLWGLLTNRGAAAVLGIALAALGRQTALALLPVVVVWLNTGAWKARPAGQRLLFMLLLPSLALGIYCVTGLAASPVSGANRNLEHLTGLFYWFAYFSTREFRAFLEFVFRGLTSSTVTLMLLAAVYARARKLITPPASFWLLLVLVASIWAQPFLGGPAITSGDIVRLCALGYVPLLTALAVLLSQSRILSNTDRPHLIMLILLIIAGSFHHLTSNIGNALHYGVAGFALVHCILAALVAMIFFLISGPRSDTSGQGSM